MCRLKTTFVSSPLFALSQNRPSLNFRRSSLTEMRKILRASGLELSIMVSVSQIREHLVDMLVSLDSEKALDIFEEWLANASWNMHLDSRVDAMQMVGKLQLAFAEFDDGSLSIAALRRSFLEIASTFEINAAPREEMVVTSGSTSPGASINQVEWLEASDRPHAEGLSYTPLAQLQS